MPEVISNRKSGNVLTFLVGSLRIGDLPIELRQYEAWQLCDAKLRAALSYLR